MAETVLATHGLRKAFGALVVTRDLDFAVTRGDIHAVIGPNGAGKTTLLAQLAGAIRPDRGAIELLGTDVTRLSADARARRGIARSFQVTTLIGEFTARENVVLGLLAREGRGFDAWQPVARRRAEIDEAQALLERTGIGALAMRRAAELSHGETRVLEIAVALAKRPHVFLLDEPMAGMGQDESRALTVLLESLRGESTIVLIEHDMAAVERLADRVTVLVEGSIVASGTFADVRADAGVRAAYLGTHDV